MLSPVLQLLYGATVLASIYCIFKSLIYNFHMFQLEGYRFSSFTGWFFKHIKHYIPELLTLLLSLTGFIENEKIFTACAAVLFVSLFAVIIGNRGRENKKPLVYTPRVKRMYVTALVLVCAVFGASVYFLVSDGNKHLAFTAVGIANAFVPLWVVLSNLINKPIEKCVNLHYTLDAKKMLKACPDLQVMGITGSYGKTSVKFYLYTILRAWTDTLVTPASFNTPMGIVKTVRGQLSAIHKIFLCEMGAKWVGDIKELCDIVHPTSGIITALGEQHLESFGSQENIIKTKYELADALPENGRLYVNWDNELIRKNPPKHKYIKYGTREDCDYRAFNIVSHSKGTSFSVKAPDGSVTDFDTKLLGEHNIINITGAIAAANGFGMPLEKMRLYVRRIEAVEHRMQIVEKGAVTIIDDAFNSNPAGCRAALHTLKSMDGLRILVTPGMVELGAKEDELNFDFGKTAAFCCDDIVLVGEKQTAAIARGVREAGFDEKHLHIFETFKEAMSFVYGGIRTEKKKLVLLENDLPDNY